MAGRKNNSHDDSDARAIVITRVFDAPRQLVFDAYVDEKHVSHWWGPRGFRTTTHQKDVRPGGVWRFIMHGPDGTDYKDRIDYIEVVRPERLVYWHRGDDDGSKFHVTLTFADEAGKTRLTQRVVFASPEEREKVIKFGAIEGGNQTLDRLGEHLANLGAVTKPFVLSREFDAPRALVFKMWTDRDHLVNWWGPKSFKVVSCTNDLRPGGVMHFCLRDPGGDDMWGKWVYRDIVAPERLVYVHSFSDPAGNTVHHPMMTTWPLEFLSTITFTERAGKTTVTVSWVPLNPTDTERKTFDDGHASMAGGWSGTFDQLGAYLGELAMLKGGR